MFKIKHVAIGHKLSMHAKKLRAAVRDSNLERGKYNEEYTKTAIIEATLLVKNTPTYKSFGT